MSRDEALFLDILLAAKDALAYVENLDWDSFRMSKLHQDAVVRTLEVIGEAARMVSESSMEKHPEIPWHELIGMRNRLIHEYFRMDLEQVWSTVQDDLPKLVTSLEKIVPSE